MDIKMFAERAWLVTRAKSPQILLGVGLCVGAYALVEAVKYGVKIERKGTIQNTKAALDGLRHDPDFAGMRGEIMLDAAKELITPAIPMISAAVISAACLAASFKILHGRYVVTAAALSSVTEAYAKYREATGQGLLPSYPGAVMDQDGKSATVTNNANDKVEEDMIAAGLEPRKLNKNGTGFGFLWDKFSTHYRAHDQEANAFHIQQVEKQLNQLLIGRGHVFLNELHDYFDVPRTSEGCLIGWVRNEKHPDTHIILFPVNTISGFVPSEVVIESNPTGVVYLDI